MKTAILVDSTASPSQALQAHEDVYVVELSVIDQAGNVYTDTTDVVKMHSFYQQLRQTDTLPTTSQPEPQSILEQFQRLIDKGYERVFVLPISAALSGTYNTLSLAGQHFDSEIRTLMIDTKGTSYKIEHMVRQLLAMLRAGYEEATIIEKLNWLADEGKIYVVVDDLNNLVKGGRLSKTGALLGSALKIKPVLYFNEKGAVEVFEKVRTMKKVEQLWVQLVQSATRQYPEGFDIAFAHGDVPEEAQRMHQVIDQSVADLACRSGYLTPVLGVHSGAGALGMGILPKVIEVAGDGYVEEAQ